MIDAKTIAMIWVALSFSLCLDIQSRSLFRFKGPFLPSAAFAKKATLLNLLFIIPNMANISRENFFSRSARENSYLHKEQMPGKRTSVLCSNLYISVLPCG
jgi:hypothetical protein